MDKFFDTLDSIFQPKKYKDLNQICPSAPKLVTSSNAHGKSTIFDSGVSAYSCNVDAPSAETFSQCSVSDATELFFQSLCSKCESTEDIDLVNIKAISASKSNLNEYPSIKCFGEHIYNRYRRNEENIELTEDQYFIKCIEGALAEGGTNFNIKEWAPALKWSNSGGSHRLATACYMAEIQQRNYQISSKLSTYSLNKQFIRSIINVFDTYILNLEERYINMLFSCFEIHNSPHTFIYLRNRSENSSSATSAHETILLMARKGHKLKGVTRRWLNRISKKQSLPSLIEMISRTG